MKLANYIPIICPLLIALKSKMKEDTSQSARNLSINKVVATAVSTVESHAI